MLTDAIAEARRQAEICNACRYCEGYCAVFPALQTQRSFSDGVVIQLANLCHNCRGCYYACQYTAPHEFDLNLPAALARTRRESWERFAFPAFVGARFHTHGVWVALATLLGFVLLFAASQWAGSGQGAGFYAVLSHGMMVAIFSVAFLLPLASLAVSLRRYWRAVGGGPVTVAQLRGALADAATLKGLSGGHGDGCNFEDEDRFSQARRHAHHAVMYGFLLCFAATCAATVMHYGFDMPAPYGFWSPPKLMGVPGGLLMTLGAAAMLLLKRGADPKLGDARAIGADMAFIGLLAFISVSGLLLYALGDSPLMPTLLAFHLGSVFSFFLLAPFSKMAHGAYRFAALVRERQSHANAR